MLATRTFYNYFVHNIEREVFVKYSFWCICCGSILSLVQIFFSFLLFLGMAIYDENMIMSLKQKKRKFEPRIKLNHNIFTYKTNPYSKSELSSRSTWWPMPPFFCS